MKIKTKDKQTKTQQKGTRSVGKVCSSALEEKKKKKIYIFYPILFDLFQQKPAVNCPHLPFILSFSLARDQFCCFRGNLIAKGGLCE